MTYFDLWQELTAHGWFVTYMGSRRRYTVIATKGDARIEATSNSLNNAAEEAYLVAIGEGLV